MPLVSEAAVFTHFNNLVLVYFSIYCTLCQCCFYKLIFILSHPLPSTCPQVCRLHSRDAEADSGADAGRSLTVLYLVHTNLSEQSHSPPLHCRWVHSSITVKVTLHIGSAAWYRLWYNPEPKWIHWSFSNTGHHYFMDLFKTRPQVCFLCIAA